jgi:hypothetical protein
MTKYHVAEVKDNPNSAKRDISFLFSSAYEKAGFNRSDGFMEVISNQVAQIFLVYRTIFNSIFEKLNVTMNGQADSINRIRNFMRPIQIFMRSVTQFFYKRLENIVVGSTYSYHKMRQLVRRSLSGFNMVFHSIEHLRNTLASVPKSPFVSMANRAAGSFGRIESGLGRLCFVDKTPLRLLNGNYINMCNALCGQVLHDGSTVKSKMIFLNTSGDIAYNIPNNGTVIQVSGSHLIYDSFENNQLRKWKHVRDYTLSKVGRNMPTVWYSVSTTTNHLRIGQVLFRDYEEVSNTPSLIFLINLLQLQNLNPTISNNAVFAYSSPHLDHGLSEHTLVKMATGDWRPLGEIQLGDFISDPVMELIKNTVGGINNEQLGNQVCGVIDLHSPSYTKYIWNGIICTGNSKVFEPSLDVWMNIEVSLSAKRILNKNEQPLNKPRLSIPKATDTTTDKTTQVDESQFELDKTVRLTETPYGFRNLLTTTGRFIVYDPVLNREIVWLDFEQVKDPIINEWIADRITDELNYNEIKKANYSSSEPASSISSI